jgi:chromosome segregation ATPase
VINDLGS